MEGREIIELISKNRCLDTEKNTKLSLKLIFLHRFDEACKEIANKDLQMKLRSPDKHMQWKHDIRAKLRGISPPCTEDCTVKVSFFLCLAICFECLGDEASKVLENTNQTKY
jgi:hypothetical protein